MSSPKQCQLSLFGLFGAGFMNAPRAGAKNNPFVIGALIKCFAPRCAWEQMVMLNYIFLSRSC